MKLKRLSYTDLDSDWQLCSMDFFPDLTLLVGISGVGKTRILEAIQRLKTIARGEGDGEKFWGIVWNVQFSTESGHDYRWEGEFESRSASNGDADDDLLYPFADENAPEGGPRVKREVLWRNDEAIIERDERGIKLHGTSTPKLSSFESALKILNEEDSVAPVHAAFDQILPADDFDNPSPFRFFLSVHAFDKQREKHTTVESIRESRLPTKLKLALLFENDRSTFDVLFHQFVQVFPQVEAMEVQRLKRGFPGEVLALRIRETGVHKWIPEHRISSGMLRTLMHLSQMLLWPDGTVFLIDEFENSLGVNCIDFITQDLIDKSQRLQFIVTSHHPYIINNISTQNWKIVSRQGAKVSARSATDLGLDRSSHESFMKLMNLPSYQEGIVAT